MQYIPIDRIRFSACFWLAAVLMGCCVASRVTAQTESTPAPAATPSRFAAPGPESFAGPPKTPLELWDAIDYLVRVGQADQAVPYLKAFLESKPDDAVLLEIRDRYGSGSIMRLSDHASTRPSAKPLMDQLVAAAHRSATEAGRINRYIQALTKTREEQGYAIGELRRAGPYAVPYLVQTLSQPVLSPEERALIVGNMGLLDETAVPALLSVLDSPDGRIAASAAEALGHIGDPRAVPYLTIFAASNDQLSPVREGSRRAIARLTGRPFDAQPQAPVRILIEQARKYLTHAIRFPADQVEVWVWDGAPTARQVSKSEAEEILGLRFAQAALKLEPANLEAQVVYLSLALGKAAERVGLSTYLAGDPTGTFASALAAGPVALGEVLRTALANGQSELAAVAATALGRVIDRDALPPDRRSAPLIEALSAPNRRVQFAAAEALVRLDARKPFPGSSRVVPVLTRFALNQTTPKAVVIDSNTSRGSQAVAFLRGLGYDPEMASSGDQGFRLASSSADVELILIEPSLFRGAWRLVDTLSNLRADAKTAGIPIFLVLPLNLHEQFRNYTLAFPRVELIVTPTSPQVLKEELDQRLAQMGARPLTPDESERYARMATVLLAQVADRPGGPFESDLPQAEAALAAALNSPATGAAAAAALADVPGVEGQRGLADVVLDPSRPTPIRLSAAFQLSRSIQRFGPLVAADQERRLAEAAAEATDPGLRNALSGVVGSLQPKADVVGRRLQSLNLSPPDSPPPAPEAVPAPTPEPPPPALEAAPEPGPIPSPGAAPTLGGSSSPR
jgi:HEAT repeat protein